MQITLRQVELFLAIVKAGNMTHAAKSIALSQSALSMALKELEDQLGGPLFDRTGRGLQLNDRGRLLYPRAHELLQRVYDIEHMFDHSNEELHGELVVAASSTIGNYLLPEILARFCSDHPNVEIKTVVGNTSDVAQAIAACNADIGFVEGTSLTPHTELKPWRDDDLVIIAHPEHPLAKFRSPTIDHLLEYDWVLREAGSGTRSVFESALAERAANVRIRMELGSSEAVKRAVQQNLGLGCLSQHVVADQLTTGQLTAISVRGLNLHRTLFSILHRDKYRTPLLDAFATACGA
ncbi:LysR family transcriptional regulator [Sulfuriroseicoccus oceanibius]|uniref:LysR family transcriptional regulator n=1 Tax=Sulfuriroseicoccus oceanibius TaxID=2707525 RepID=A0A6B3LAF2_9BACT|nr:LysR family transcriptional regulator [Sulfuriroseicoccus oceanibius]QQL43972.1 LysR family transcriptional regulator [Sulfuriroseicoccus oceanibius]